MSIIRDRTVLLVCKGCHSRYGVAGVLSLTRKCNDPPLVLNILGYSDSLIDTSSCSGNALAAPWNGVLDKRQQVGNNYIWSLEPANHPAQVSINGIECERGNILVNQTRNIPDHGFNRFRFTATGNNGGAGNLTLWDSVNNDGGSFPHCLPPFSQTGGCASGASSIKFGKVI